MICQLSPLFCLHYFHFFSSSSSHLISPHLTPLSLLSSKLPRLYQRKHRISNRQSRSSSSTTGALITSIHFPCSFVPYRVSRPHITHHYLSICHRHLDTKSRSSFKTRQGKAPRRSKVKNPQPSQTSILGRHPPHRVISSKSLPCSALPAITSRISAKRSGARHEPGRWTTTVLNLDLVDYYFYFHGYYTRPPALRRYKIKLFCLSGTNLVLPFQRTCSLRSCLLCICHLVSSPRPGPSLPRRNIDIDSVPPASPSWISTPHHLKLHISPRLPDT